jgi:hypothetical protein
MAFPFSSGSLAEFRVDMVAYNLYATILIYLEYPHISNHLFASRTLFCNSYAVEPGHPVVKHGYVLWGPALHVRSA